LDIVGGFLFVIKESCQSVNFLFMAKNCQSVNFIVYGKKLSEREFYCLWQKTCQSVNSIVYGNKKLAGHAFFCI